MLTLAEAASQIGAASSPALQSPTRRLTRGALGSLAAGSRQPGDAVALSIASPFDFIGALLKLDGRVGKMLLLSPELPAATIHAMMASENIPLIVSDRADMAGAIVPADVATLPARCATLWGMTSSGTTGTPKIAYHRIEGLAATVKRSAVGEAASWGLLYEASRFAAVQVVLQSLLGGGCLLLPDQREPLHAKLNWLASYGCSHVSATPSLWRQMLMLPAFEQLKLRQMTLGGEIADAPLLAALRRVQPAARCTQIYALTEAGVGFSESDGAEGFRWPLFSRQDGVRARIENGELWIRPEHAEMASCAERSQDGYIRTGDRIEVIGERCYFRGRREDMIKVGGSLVDLSEVERVVRSHAAVLNCQITARNNPLVGNVIALSVVADQPKAEKVLRADIAAWCRQRLPREACPATIAFVDAIALSSSGKAVAAR